MTNNELKEEILQKNGVYYSGKIDEKTHQAILKSMSEYSLKKLVQFIRKYL